MALPKKSHALVLWGLGLKPCGSFKRSPREATGYPRWWLEFRCIIYWSLVFYGLRNDMMGKIYFFICMYVYIHIYIYIHEYMWACMYIVIYIYTYIYTIRIHMICAQTDIQVQKDLWSRFLFYIMCLVNRYRFCKMDAEQFLSLSNIFYVFYAFSCWLECVLIAYGKYWWYSPHYFQVSILWLRRSWPMRVAAVGR